MDELGHILREARETKGLTLQEVQLSTRISPRYLDALENGDYDRLPSAVHTRGFLRNYARFLGLDPQPLLDRYESSQGRQTRKKAQPLIPQEPIGQALKEPPADHHFFEPVNMSIDAGYGRVANSGNRSETVMRLVIIAALACLIYMTVQFFIPRLSGNDERSAEVTEGIQNAVQNLFTPEEEATETPTPDELLDLAPSSILTSTSRNDYSNSLDTAVTPTATRPILPTMEQIELDIVITERAWMQVTIDGDVVFSGNARPGDNYEWTAQSNAEINTGNAIGVDVSINGINLGPLGARGQNVQESWSTTQ